MVLGRERGWRNRDGVGEWKGGGGRGWDKGREKEERRRVGGKGERVRKEEGERVAG